MNKDAVSLEAVHTHTHTQYVYKTQELVDSLERESYNLEDRISILPYALLNVYARDG